MYVFDLKNGKQKIAYGQNPEDALDILAIRLSPAEMDEIIKDQYKRISQRRLHEFIDNLG